MMNMIYDMLTLAAATTVLAVSAATDVRNRKVPNAATFPAMAIGIAATAATNPSEALMRCAWLVLLFAFGAMRLMGLGDLKLVMALAALRGAREASLALLSGALLLMAYCFITEPEKMKIVLKDTVGFLTVGKPIRKISDKQYPFAAFIAVGYPIAWALSGNVRW